MIWTFVTAVISMLHAGNPSLGINVSRHNTEGVQQLHPLAQALVFCRPDEGHIHSSRWPVWPIFLHLSGEPFVMPSQEG